MNVKMMDPNDLIPAEVNVKHHPPEQVQLIAQSIKNFGFDQPIVVNPDLVIIKGHGRRLAALELGMKTVPVIVSEKTDDQLDRLNRLLDNNLTSKSYDAVLLRGELCELKDVGKLGLTLYTEDMIPEVDKLVSKAQASVFSLVPTHKCSVCSYRW